MEGEVYAVGALAAARIHEAVLTGLCEDRQDQAVPIFGYTAVVWREDGFYVAAERTDDPEPWDPRNCDVDQLEQQVELLNERYPHNRLYQHLIEMRAWSTNA